MKKTLLTVLIFLFAFSLSAKDMAENSFSLDAGGGLYYNANPSTNDGFITNVLNVIFSLRGGVEGSMRYILSEDMSVGANLGIQYMSSSTGKGENKVSSSLVDLPLTVIFRYSLGNIMFQPFAGATFNLKIREDTELFTGIYAGSKVFYGNWFIDAGYVISLKEGTTSYPRFGLGYTLHNVLGF